MIEAGALWALNEQVGCSGLLLVAGSGLVVRRMPDSEDGRREASGDGASRSDDLAEIPRSGTNPIRLHIGYGVTCRAHHLIINDLGAFRHCFLASS